MSPAAEATSPAADTSCSGWLPSTCEIVTATSDSPPPDAHLVLVHCHPPERPGDAPIFGAATTTRRHVGTRNPEICGTYASFRVCEGYLAVLNLFIASFKRCNACPYLPKSPLRCASCASDSADSTSLSAADLAGD